MIKSLSNEEIMDVAKKIYKGDIFTTDHIRKEDLNIAPVIFIPLIAIDQQMKKDLDDAGFIYERIEEAGSRSINGYPTFFSAHIVNKADAKKIWKKVKEIEKAINSIN